MDSNTEVRDTVRSALRADGMQASVTIFGPDGDITSVFDDARHWYVGGYGDRGQWIDLEDGGLRLYVRHQQTDADAGDEEVAS